MTVEELVSKFDSEKLNKLYDCIVSLSTSVELILYLLLFFGFGWVFIQFVKQRRYFE